MINDQYKEWVKGYLDSRASIIEIDFDTEELSVFTPEVLQGLLGLTNDQVAYALMASLFNGDVELFDHLMRIRPGVKIDYRFVDEVSAGVKRTSRGLFSRNDSIVDTAVTRFNATLRAVEQLKLPDHGELLYARIMSPELTSAYLGMPKPKFVTRSVNLLNQSLFMPSDNFKLPVLSKGKLNSPELMITLMGVNDRPVPEAYEGILCWATREMLDAFPQSLVGLEAESSIHCTQVGGCSADNDANIPVKLPMHSGAGGVELARFSRDQDDSGQIGAAKQRLVFNGVEIGISPVGQHPSIRDVYSLQYYSNGLIKSGLAPEFRDGLVLCCTTTGFLSKFETGSICTKTLADMKEAMDHFLPFTYIAYLKANNNGHWPQTHMPSYREPGRAVQPGDFCWLLSESSDIALAFRDVAGPEICELISHECLRFNVNLKRLRGVLSLVSNHALLSNAVLVLDTGDVSEIMRHGLMIPNGMKIEFEGGYDYDNPNVDDDIESLINRLSGKASIGGIGTDTPVGELLPTYLNLDYHMDGSGRGYRANFLRKLMRMADIDELIATADTDEKWEAVVEVCDKDDLIDRLPTLPAKARVHIVESDFNL